MTYKCSLVPTRFFRFFLIQNVCIKALNTKFFFKNSRKLLFWKLVTILHIYACTLLSYVFVLDCRLLLIMLFYLVIILSKVVLMKNVD